MTIAVSALLLAAFLSHDTRVATHMSATSPNAPVARVLRHLVDDLRKSRLMPAADQAAVETFYRKRGFSPLWIADGQMTDRARGAIECLGDADAEGLRSADYAIAELARDADAKALARAELGLTRAVLAYAHDAAIGRVPYDRVSSEIAYQPQPFGRLAALERVAEAKDAAETLRSFNPTHAGYRALKRQLSEYRAALVKAKGVKPRSSGSVSEASRLESVVRTIVANMERWRWMPRDLGADHVMVNIPDFTLKIVRADAAVWTTKVVVGDPLSPTPITSADMTSITLNPIWNIPKSIVEKEYLTAIGDELERMDRLGIRSARSADGSLHVYQLPGEWSALGQVRFNFPNKFAVYQHDTPEQYLFARKSRAFSHGCIRVEKPLIYAQALLAIVAPERDYSAERIYGLLGGDEFNIELPKAMPVHLTYQTAFVDDAGKLQLRDDIYGHDQRLLAASMRAPASNVAQTPEKPPVVAKGLLVRMADWLDRQRHRLGV
ncbi:MAG TPA: L,D-transpeptidase family protein [Bradyrhizobium sp.]|uniref:L,D-transpeptidase family protein n=1 Tax=Bradyrhizobium sp. TaxID=376 RepID=UPI002D7EF105|nr:L,D-transpeptidase family protein [Bradyrhizobium sp.]HET7886339.1 L,D-transpeptidase family protein [Bradyrhizobium sp.]